MFAWVWGVTWRWGSSQEQLGLEDGMKLLFQNPLEILLENFEGRSTRVPVIWVWGPVICR